MKRTVLRGLMIGALTLGLGACNTWDVEGVRGMPSTGSAFDQALHQEYVQLAELEIAEYDWDDGSFFLERAKEASRGEVAGPQPIANRYLPADKVGELTAARERLVRVLGAAKTRKPQIAAKAQAGFDCWMQEQEENHQPDDIAACKKMFEDAMRMLENAGPFLLFFDWDSAVVNSAGMDVLRQAAEAGHGWGSASLVGHTDRSGPAGYNQGLSVRRANAAAAALKKLGFGGATATDGQGETNPLVQTKDGVREPQNRRVEINFE
ncbi:MAG: OmpA family protein [Magnetospiraceae bacterium]